MNVSRELIISAYDRIHGEYCGVDCVDTCKELKKALYIEQRNKPLNEPQPMPEANNNPAMWDLVVADMRQRDIVGVTRYGVRLQAHNGRNALIDAYQEALDLVVYLRQAIYEQTGA